MSDLQRSVSSKNGRDRDEAAEDRRCCRTESTATRAKWNSLQ